MTDVATWHVFAYMHDDEAQELDVHRMVSDWRLEDVLRGLRFRGYDAILLTRVSTAVYSPPPLPRQCVAQHWMGTAV